MKKYAFLFLLLTFNSFGQNNSWNKKVLKLKEEVSTISTSNRKFEIKNDTLLMTLKPLNNENKTIKIPLKKIVSLMSSFNQLILFTRKEKTDNDSYSCRKVDDSKITLLNSFEREKHTSLITTLRKLIAINRAKKKKQ